MWTEELDELKEAYETWYQLKKDDVGDINKNKSTSKKKNKKNQVRNKFHKLFKNNTDYIFYLFLIKKNEKNLFKN